MQAVVDIRYLMGMWIAGYVCIYVYTWIRVINAAMPRISSVFTTTKAVFHTHAPRESERTDERTNERMDERINGEYSVRACVAIGEVR